ncbi:LPXTG-motif cell wall-anchored protein [Virgibacillus halotolerans]|uniref:LPXTG cell wall anchor domain-containing protein n=1 Tax=Virgibacillus halotolerans TaxID=1071053 RepID=UPI003B84A73A|nr:LPXTG-motif cell wall-anchored protein [Virgibacillus halotolerans]
MELEVTQSQEDEDGETVESDPAYVTVLASEDEDGDGDADADADADADKDNGSSEDNGADTGIIGGIGSTGGGAGGSPEHSGLTGNTNTVDGSNTDGYGEGNKLPDTATSTYNWLFAGLLAMMAGAAGLFTRRKKDKIVKKH